MKKLIKEVIEKYKAMKQKHKAEKHNRECDLHFKTFPPYEKMPSLERVARGLVEDEAGYWKGSE